ncbi:hypothetical protein DFH06DRAFT_1314608 [Mycena polygramma]|nr:hypothetical protein DFH06DRAFT_1314608 [Mycena polygramma]
MDNRLRVTEVLNGLYDPARIYRAVCRQSYQAEAPCWLNRYCDAMTQVNVVRSAQALSEEFGEAILSKVFSAVANSSPSRTGGRCGSFHECRRCARDFTACSSRVDSTGKTLSGWRLGLLRDKRDGLDAGETAAWHLALPSRAASYLLFLSATLLPLSFFVSFYFLPLPIDLDSKVPPAPQPQPLPRSTRINASHRAPASGCSTPRSRFGSMGVIVQVEVAPGIWVSSALLLPLLQIIDFGPAFPFPAPLFPVAIIIAPFFVVINGALQMGYTLRWHHDLVQRIAPPNHFGLTLHYHTHGSRRANGPNPPLIVGGGVGRHYVFGWLHLSPQVQASRQVHMICVRNIGKQHSPFAMEYPGYTPVRHPQLLPNILPPGVSDTLVNRLHLEAGILPTTIEATETFLAVAGFPPGTRQVLEGMLDGLVKEHGESRIPWAGAKPELLQNTDRVILFPIPGTDLGIRVFPGDLHPRDGMFFFDLYDRTRRVRGQLPAVVLIPGPSSRQKRRLAVDGGGRRDSA